MKRHRPALALVACLSGSGCYLSSVEPRFGDKQAELILGDSITRFALFDRDGTG